MRSGKVKVVWTRHVTNRALDADGEPWDLRGEGELTLVE